MRKPKDWEPEFFVTPMSELSDLIGNVFSRYQGGSSKGNTAQSDQVVTLLNQLKGQIMALSAQVQSLVDEVAATKSIEAASATAMAGMAKQISDLQAQVAAAAANGTISAEDAAAIAQSVSDLKDGATALQAAVPANTDPAAAAPAAPAAPGA